MQINEDHDEKEKVALSSPRKPIMIYVGMIFTVLLHGYARANPCTASADTAARMIITGGANGYKELDDAANSVTMTDANVVQYNNHNICMGTLNTSKFKTRSLWVPIGKAPNQTVEIIQALDPNYMVATQESIDDYNSEQERQKEENAKWREQTQAKIQKENHKNKLLGGLGGLLQDLTQ